VLAKIFGAFHETYPEIRLDIKDIPGAQIMDALTNREVDLACTYAQHGPGIDAYPFMKDSLALLCRKDSDLAQHKVLKWKQLVDRPLIAMAEGTTVRTLIDGIIAARELHLNIVLEPKMIATAIAYVRAGLGVAVLPTAGISAQLSLELARVDLVDPKISRDISVLSLKDYSLSPAAQALREMILLSAER
jgi:LysR family carnitine catabolism transcriptional activator